MLVLSRFAGEKIRLTLGDVVVWVTVCEVDRGKVRVGITAPADVHVIREELVPDDERQGAD
jgi:carbon storage regulator